jgi:predicted SnoaL-like aldol condensation-catalyzing enzyme
MFISARLLSPIVYFLELIKMQQPIKSESSRQMESVRKDIALEFFNLISQGKFKEGLRFFSPECKTHNPYIAGNMNTLTDAMVAANKEGAAKNPEAEFAVKHVLADGDLVAVHTQLLSSKSNLGQGGLRQVHVFRFEDDKIVEYWDITQQVTPDMPNAAGAF